MAQFEGFKAKLFRTDRAGRMVFVQENTRQVYVIPDDAEATRIAHFVYTTRQVVILAIVVSFFAVAWHSWLWIGIPLSVLIGHLAVRRRVSSMRRSDDQLADLPQIDRAAQRQAYNVALGRRYFWNIIAGSAVVGVIILAVLLLPAAQRAYVTGSDSRHMLRLGWMAMVVYCAGSIVLGVRGLRSIGAASSRRPQGGATTG